MEIKAKFSIPEDRASAAIYLVKMLEGKGGSIPVQHIVGLLVPGDMAHESLGILSGRGEFQVNAVGEFINETTEKTIVPGLEIPGVGGESRLELGPVIEGRIHSITPDSFEVEFSREKGIVGSTINGTKTVGKGRHLGFKLGREKLIIRTEAMEPVFVRGMKIDMAVSVV